MSEWKEGKPEEAYETVWAWDGENVTAAYVDCLGVWHSPWHGAIKTNVTHWQEIEIPEPPKGEREMSNLVEHAKSELALLGNDEMQQSMNEEIIKVIETFSKGGHSGFSAGYAIRAIERLLRFLPLKPLTGEDDEWNHVSDGLYQNKRCGSVFKEDGITYDIGAEIFSDDGGETFYTKGGHRTYIEFPYSPPTHPKKIYTQEASDER